MTLEEMKSRKKELGYTNRIISEKSGVPLGTVQKIFSGFTTTPRMETIIALEKVLRKVPEKDHWLYDKGEIYNNPRMVEMHEEPFEYDRSRSYTYEDYRALPDNVRVELIDGQFYDMAAPGPLHQAIAGVIYNKLLSYILEHKGNCFPLMSPVDVKLDQDDDTAVQPDVMVICDRDKFKGGFISGAPDLVVEVLSPSTRRKDMQLKLFKYGNAGVREYWMIDPKKKVIVQQDLEHDETPVIYGFGDRVPVLIWNGECVIDFKEVSDLIGFLWDAE